MSFKFDFQDDDIEEAAVDQQQILQSNGHAGETLNPLDEMDVTIQNTPVVKAPTIIDLHHVLNYLKDVRFTFDIFQTPTQGVTLYRREVFDVKHQLMQEEENSASNELEILIGDTNEDLKQFIYEGGLKSWECSIDLVDYLSSTLTVDPQSFPSTVVEIGCGTSLPSEYVFILYLQTYCLNNTTPGPAPGLKLILTDYNESVLKLVTIPNIIISWAKTVYGPHWGNSPVWTEGLQKDLPCMDDEFTLTQELILAFQEFCSLYKIEIQLLSGSWSRSFQNLIHPLIIPNSPNDKTLFLSSETIYQPKMLPVISETLIDFQQNPNINKENQVILVAAKDIYFGVGGSVVDFTTYLNKRNAPYEILKVNAGLKRSIVIMK